MNAKAYMYTDNGLCDEELEGLTGKTLGESGKDEGKSILETE